MKALLSLYRKEGSETFARELIKRGFTIISSGGTAKYLQGKGIPVTEVSTITGYGPVLGHRVVTLAPQIHGGLLATPEMQDELKELGWPTIDLLYVTFYPLSDELIHKDSTFRSCIEKTDIGGPTMVRSANKGGNVVVLTDSRHEHAVLRWIDDGRPDEEAFLFALRAKAETDVAKYIQQSAEVYYRFGEAKGLKPMDDFPRYLMRIDGHDSYLPIGAAGQAYDSGMVKVEIGGTVLERDYTVRKITAEEGRRIAEIADEYSASK